jgi:hypothetical protein
VACISCMLSEADTELFTCSEAGLRASITVTEGKPLNNSSFGSLPLARACTWCKGHAPKTDISHLPDGALGRLLCAPAVSCSATRQLLERLVAHRPAHPAPQCCRQPGRHGQQGGVRAHGGRAGAGAGRRRWTGTPLKRTLPAADVRAGQPPRAELHAASAMQRCGPWICRCGSPPRMTHA